MQYKKIYLFQDFILDLDNARLFHGQTPCKLRPKAFAMLRYFVERPGQLVTKDELFQALWPNIVVDKATLTGCIRELRTALNDNSKQPRCIETVPTRGYRFIAPLSTKSPISRSTFHNLHSEKKQPQGVYETGNLKPDSLLVGRDAELAQLHRWFEKAQRGECQIVFVTGEPGIGKTLLVDTFLQELARTYRCWQMRGHCIELYGESEAYLPVLDALGQIAKEVGEAALLRILRRHAPSWLEHFPALFPEAEIPPVSGPGVTRQRRLRELTQALMALTSETPLVFLLEDLHWSDYSTLNFLSTLAQNSEPTRLFVIGTYRPVEVLTTAHPLQAVAQELFAHKRAQVIRLGGLTTTAVTEYLAARFSQHALPEGFAATLQSRTEGNPLFLVNLTNDLVDQHLITQSDGTWTLKGTVQTVTARIPDSSRFLIEKQMARLTPEVGLILEAASVAGAEFAVAAIAPGLALPEEQVEEQCATLVRQELFLRPTETSTWPDGTQTARYSFRHALYQQLWYERVPALRRRRLHAHIGRRYEEAYGQRTHEIAAELATHFERGQKHHQAWRYLCQAGENAVRRGAVQEAVTLFTRGITLLQTLPETPERDRQELLCQATLGAALVATKGYAASEVETAYMRALELCQRIGEASHLFPVLWGLWAVYAVRADHTKALGLGEQLLELAQQQQDPAFLVQAHWALGQPLLFMGALARAREHFAQGVALYDPQRHRPDQSPVFRAGQDPGVNCLAMAARIPWAVGYPDQAVQKVNEALAFAHSLRHPLTLAYALGAAAIIHQLRREPREAQRYADTAIALCTEHELSFYLALGRIWRGWALTEQGELAEGLASLQEGLSTWRALGAEIGLTHYLTPLIEAHRKAGHLGEAEAVLAEAFALVEKNAERFYEAELYRLRGELTLQKEGTRGWGLGTSSSSPQTPSLEPLAPNGAELEAEECFRTAITIARQQQAKALELRAAMNLVRLRQQQAARSATHKTQHVTSGTLAEAHRMLSDVYNWFTEGFDTTDLQEAKQLLEEIGEIGM